MPIDIQKDKYGLYSSPKKALSLFDMPIYTSIKLVVAEEAAVAKVAAILA